MLVYLLRISITEPGFMALVSVLYSVLLSFFIFYVIFVNLDNEAVFTENFSVIHGINSIYPVKSPKYIIRIIYPELGLCVRIYFSFLF